MLEGFWLRKGSVPGYKHLRKGINNQDAYFVDQMVIDEVPYLYGAVGDGCSLGGKKVARGQSVRTEVGAVLLTSFIRSEVPLLLASHVPVNQFPQSLYHRCVSYLANVARTTVVGGPQVQWDFIERNLLATVIGFVMNQKVLVTFAAGDGMIIIDDKVTAIDQKDRPTYLAYHLVDRTILGPAADKLPTSFDWAVYPMLEINRFAICTDGIEEAWQKEPGIINNIWGYESQAPAGLQWWLNKGARVLLFGDDCTVIGVNRVSLAAMPEEDSAQAGEEASDED